MDDMLITVRSEEVNENLSAINSLHHSLGLRIEMAEIDLHHS